MPKKQPRTAAPITAPMPPRAPANDAPEWVDDRTLAARTPISRIAQQTLFGGISHAL